jgi:tetratricopeptide (TPR) repeat protein
VIVGALAALGRPQEADRMVGAYSKWIDNAGRSRMLRTVAWGWVKAGDLARAHATLDSAGGEDAADEVSAWLALYEGRVKDARDGFRVLQLGSPESMRVMSLLARTRVDSAPAVGRAFLLLAKGDTVAAADAMLASASEVGDAAPVLMAMSARLALGKGDDARAVRIWTRILDEYGSAPEAPEAALEWGRQLRRRGEYRAAIARLEQMILSYPNSALVPQARRELELARAGVRASE